MAEVLIARLGELALAEESMKGTKVASSTLVDGTSSKFRVYDLTYTPDVQLFERGTAAATLSRYAHLVGQTLGKISGRIEQRKTAAAGTADAWQSILKAGGLKLASSIWSPSSVQSDHKTLTAYCFMGSTGAATVRIGLRGAMCSSLKFVGKVGAPGMWEFEILGISDGDDVDGTPSNTFALKPTDDALNTITHEGAVPTVFQGVAFTYGGATKRLSTFELDLGLGIAPRDDVSSDQGVLHYVITDRQPKVTIDPDFGLVANTDDYLTHLHVGTEVALAWAYLVSTSRTFTFAAPKAQVIALTPGNRNGIATQGVTLALNRSAEPGDDEFTITES